MYIIFYFSSSSILLKPQWGIKVIGRAHLTPHAAAIVGGDRHTMGPLTSPALETKRRFMTTAESIKQLHKSGLVETLP